MLLNFALKPIVMSVAVKSTFVIFGHANELKFRDVGVSCCTANQFFTSTVNTAYGLSGSLEQVSASC